MVFMVDWYGVTIGKQSDLILYKVRFEKRAVHSSPVANSLNFGAGIETGLQKVVKILL